MIVSGGGKFFLWGDVRTRGSPTGAPFLLLRGGGPPPPEAIRVWMAGIAGGAGAGRRPALKSVRIPRRLIVGVVRNSRRGCGGCSGACRRKFRAAPVQGLVSLSEFQHIRISADIIGSRLLIHAMFGEEMD